ncbi:MAG: VWA domain-containing protein [Chitinophagaceae bacterium]|nr:VWA domain-containing protein [Chitinophagaceae bacterium]
MLRFEHTGYLFLLLLIPLLVLLYRNERLWKQETIKKIGEERLVKQLIGNFSARRHATRFMIVLGALGSLIIGAANLQSGTGMESIHRRGIDVVIALDVSRSMLAKDVQPSRLDRSKMLITRLLTRLESDRVALVIFAGKAYLQMPLTTDLNAADLFVNSADPEMVPVQGTVIAHALQVANGAFSIEDKKYKAIILITDGEDHDKEAVKTAKELSENGVVINTVGVGSPVGATVWNPATGETMRDAHNEIVISKLNEQLLNEIAQEANGVYQSLSDIDIVTDNIKKQLDGMDQKLIRDNRLVNYRSFFQWFLLLAFTGLTVELFISEKKRPL